MTISHHSPNPQTSLPRSRLKLTRRQSQRLAVLLIAIFLGLAFFLSHDDKRAFQAPVEDSRLASQDTPPTQATPTPEPLAATSKALSELVESASDEAQSSVTNTATITLDKFHRSQIVDGKLLWDAKGDRAQVDPVTGIISVENADVKFRENEGLVSFTANNAEVLLQNSELESAIGKGSVVIDYHDQIQFYSDHAAYSKGTGSVEAQGPVRIEHEQMTTTGINLVGDLQTEAFHLKGPVKTVIKSMEGKSPENKQHSKEQQAKRRKRVKKANVDSQA